MQLALFNAAEHVMAAYDQLVLAWEDAELEQLDSLKLMTLRTYVALMDMYVDHPVPPEQVTLDVPF